MQVKELKQDGLSYEMEITLKAADIDSRVETRLRETGKTVNIPGFRPGKVPLNILKQRYGRMVMGEVLEKAVNESSARVLQDKELKPAIQPKIEVKEFEEGKDLIYAMSVEVLPAFEIADFKGLKLEKPVTEPADKDVEEALEKIAENREHTKKVETRRGAKEGDTVVIDFHGRTADDNKEHEGMHAHDHDLKLGSGQFIPGFEDQLKGKKSGDEVEVKVSFPEEYGAEELAGREAIFDVKIKELREPGEVKIDDAFAKELGLDDLKALKEAVAEQLQQEYDGQSRMVLKKRLLDYLDDVHAVEIPPTMLELEHKNILDQLELERQRAPEEEKKDLTDEEKQEYKDIAARRVRLGLILSEIGRRNNLSVSDPELQKAVIAEAQKYPGQEKDVFDYYAKNRQALESLRAPLYEEKVVDYILELANIEEKAVSPEKLYELLEEDEDADKAEKKTGKKTAKKSKAKTGKKTGKKSSGAKKKTASAAKKKSGSKSKAGSKSSAAKKKSGKK